MNYAWKSQSIHQSMRAYTVGGHTLYIVWLKFGSFDISLNNCVRAALWRVFVNACDRCLAATRNWTRKVHYPFLIFEGIPELEAVLFLRNNCMLNQLVPNSHIFSAVAKKRFSFIFAMLNYLRWSIAQFIWFNLQFFFHLLCAFFLSYFIRDMLFKLQVKQLQEKCSHRSTIGWEEKWIAISFFSRSQNFIPPRIFA